MNDSPYIIIEPKSAQVPLILSVPHCGTEFPSEIIDDFIADKIVAPDDTDWFVHQLYNFASDLGVTIIHARYSRWVIDLNRDPQSAPLYDDGRIITGLTPATDFFGEEIYEAGKIPDSEEISRRLNEYYWPYYAQIESLIKERKSEFGKVLLWDAHSIRHSVPTIRKEVFPDMILGDNNGVTASPHLINTALENLRSGTYQINHNSPFKGGHITRYFGAPDNNTHALQLEMNKILYMDDSETMFDEARADDVRSILSRTFESLINSIDQV